MSTVTYDKVAAAAEALVEQRAEVTVDSVRQVLGTGSRFLIDRFLTRWSTQQTQPLGAESSATNGGDGAESGEMAVPDAAVEALQSLWSSLVKEGRESIESVQGTAEALGRELRDWAERSQRSEETSMARCDALEAGLHRCEETMRRLDTRLRSEAGKRVASEAEMARRLDALAGQVQELGARVTSVVETLAGVDATEQRLRQIVAEELARSEPPVAGEKKSKKK